jgi:hypothetical protein
LAQVAKHFGFTWADMLTLKQRDVSALVEQINKEQRQQKQAETNRR